MTRQATEIKVYWDSQDPSNEGWAYRLSDSQGDIDSGSIDGCGNDELDAAVDEAIRISGLDLKAYDFAREPEIECGYAVWSKPESDAYPHRFAR